MNSWTLPQIVVPDSKFDLPLQARLDRKTKPHGALGRLEKLAVRIGRIQGTLFPCLRAPTVLVFAGDHGLAAEGVSPYPQEVTAQMVRNFLAGGAAINVFARQLGLALEIIDAGVAGDLPADPRLRSLSLRCGTRNALDEMALTPGEVDRGMAAGAGIVAELSLRGTNAVLLGEMGIGNSSIAALLMSSLLELPLSICVGRGAGQDEAGLARKCAVLERVQQRHGRQTEPRAALAAYGGCEIAMLVGAILEAASRRLLIVIDGFIVTSALLVAAKFSPAVLEYSVFGHTSAESGHKRLIEALGGEPLLELGLRLGEGTGAALAWPLIQAAVNALQEMATFDSAKVSEKVSEDGK